MSKHFDIIVIGAGINGLATAYALSRYPHLKVAIVEQFSVGHTRGGSHGASRITRSVYSDPIYVKLMQWAHENEWTRWEKEAGSSLIHRNSACYYGAGKTFEKYLASIASCELDIHLWEADAARRAFPQFRFPGAKAVMEDRTGGVIAAQETMAFLKRLILQRGVTLFETTKILGWNAEKNPIALTSSKGEILAERIVVTAGAWIYRLVPQLQPFLTPIRQTVGYYRLRGAQSAYEIGSFPNWAFIGDGENQTFYGLPRFHSEGIKIACHRTVGKKDDPDELADSDPSQLHFLDSFLREHFVQPIEQLVSSETCLYANTPNEEFIIDLLPQDQRIAIGSVCSGHGFKFAPLTGRLLAELVMHGKTTVPPFEEQRSRFSLPYK